MVSSEINKVSAEKEKFIVFIKKIYPRQSVTQVPDILLFIFPRGKNLNY